MSDGPDALVAGATGFIGRWPAAELLARGRTVAAAVRGGPARGDALRAWLRDRGADDRALTVVAADITRRGLSLSPADRDRLDSVRDVFNAAAVYRFGMGRDEARRANVDGALHVARWAGTLPRLTFVPVVTVDHLARFMAAVPEHDGGCVRAHWVLDGATPELPELIGLLARHLGVRAPRAVVPVGLVRRLPRALTGSSPRRSPSCPRTATTPRRPTPSNAPPDWRTLR
ncbi:SDR family oxidoreductase [Actinomadura sp. LOL_016]|uniref:SDR family oxidoreductase n=1 Tax=unclassified Actinomadura TaxID=2626254 RepID=UPI003A7FE154